MESSFDDPDLGVELPLREISAMLNLIESVVGVLDGEVNQAENTARALLPLDADPVSMLPEVGPVIDLEGLRLHLHRLHVRLSTRLAQHAVPLEAPPVTVPSDGEFKFVRATRSLAIVDDDLAEAFVWWDDITEEDVSRYEAVLNSASDERPMQRHLATNPKLLVQHFGGGHGRWVMSQKRLGGEYVPDFVIGEKSSSGFEWQFVELQSPNARLFVASSGRQSAQLDEGIRQILEWRRWVDSNRDYARRPRAQDGLGLVDVSGKEPGLLIIGREDALTDRDKERRRQLDHELNIRIHTYDWLARQARSRVESLRRRSESVTLFASPDDEAN